MAKRLRRRDQYVAESGNLQFTSTFSSNALNEFRFPIGTQIWRTIWRSPTMTRRSRRAFDFLTKINGIPTIQKPTLFPDHMIVCPGDLTCSNRGNRSPLTGYTDTFSWTKGAHAMKFGGEFRFAHSFSWSPQTSFRRSSAAPAMFPYRALTRVAGLLPNSRTLAENLLLTLSGSVGSISERFEIREPTDTRFLDFRDTYFHSEDPKIFGRIRDWHQNEMSFFAKDDWRITPNFTLNLGMRYDLFRVPYLVSASGAGFTPGLEGGNDALFGYSGAASAAGCRAADRRKAH